MSEQGSGGGGPEEIGSVADEATKLLGAVADWARDHGSDLGAGVAALADQAAASAHEINAHIATDHGEYVRERDRALGIPRQAIHVIKRPHIVSLADLA